MSLPLHTSYRLGSEGPDLDALLEFLGEAHSAPSVAALAPWAFVVVKPPFEPLFFVGVTDVVTPSELDVADLAADAAWLVVVLGEHNSPRWEESTFVVAAALCAAARRAGWATVWFQPVDPHPILELIKAPDWYRLAAVIAIGKPGEPVDKYQEKPLNSVIVLHENGENRVLEDEEQGDAHKDES